MQVLGLLQLLLVLTLTTAINTDYILNKYQLYCRMVPELTCEWHDGILVVDWMKNKQEDLDQLWVFNEHARETITGDLAFFVIKDIINLMPDRRITIIPVLNVWGRKEVEQGHECLRKNENGVDTNRNYQIDMKHRYFRSSEEYEGPHPLSEKETKLVSSLLLSGVQRYINVHSGEYSMYMPFDSNVTPPPNADRMRHVLNTLHPMCPQCVQGSAGEVSTYKAYGTSVDYAIKKGVPEAYTFEIYGAISSHCKEMFNPSGYEDTRRVLMMWRRILMSTVIDETLSNPPKV